MALTGTSVAAEVEFRQLRHQTKNALTRILAQVSSGLSINDASRRVAAEVERRVLLTAQISDALFGLTREPGPFDARLWTLCDGVVDLIGECDQHLQLACDVIGDVPPQYADTVLRVAHEFVGNAVKHGMHMRLIGRIGVRVVVSSQDVMLEVRDDGWGCGRGTTYGEGMRVASILAEAFDGRVALERCGDETIARLVLPAAHNA